jgi:predicted DNA-binding protein
MPRAKDATAIELPVVLRDRLARLKVHERQAFHEVIEQALDVYEDLLRGGRPSAEVLSRPFESATS